MKCRHCPRKRQMCILLQPLRWCCVDCVIHHERDVREEQHHTYTWREQAIIEWSWHVNSIVACCHSAKLCAHAARDFRSQQYDGSLSWSFMSVDHGTTFTSWSQHHGIKCLRKSQRYKRLIRETPPLLRFSRWTAHHKVNDKDFTGKWPQTDTTVCVTKMK